MQKANNLTEAVELSTQGVVPKPESTTLGDVGIWMAFLVGGMVFIAGIWKALTWAVSTINKPVLSQLEKHELRIAHLEDGHRSIKDEVAALRSEIKSEFRDLKDDLSQQISALTAALLNKK